ncbi:hypothetical protein EBAPG3_011395 [Nitrosospira lacus]|uniref:Uncharacterized protein n=1 Tax=Nitrosospira lacus TaxID=1288494 RepID=A0A1W6SRB3_9PROT|nr:hypothetical protein EBAPG3_011395 [Nitrosospira lacus]
MDQQVYPDQPGEGDLPQVFQVDAGPEGLAKFENISSWAGAVGGAIGAKTGTPSLDGVPH